MKMNAISLLILVIVGLSIATATADETTSFVLNGYVNNATDDPCNEPWVRVTNMNTSTSWDAQNSSTSNYYQLVLSGNNVSEGNILEINASGCSQSKIMFKTVSQDEIDDGGIFNYNITTFSITKRAIIKIRNTFRKPPRFFI